MADPRILFLSLASPPPSQEVPADWLRRRGTEIPGPGDDTAGVLGVRVALMGTGDVLLPGGETGRGALLAFWPQEDPLNEYAGLVEALAVPVEWGVCFTIGSRTWHACPDEADARRVAALMREKNREWNAVVAWRTAARPAGPWTEEAASGG